MKILKTYILLLSCIKTILLQNINPKPLCNSNYNCTECESCLSEIQNYESCYYYNLFCKNNSQILYSSFLKNEYIQFFDGIPEMNSFCGKKKFVIGNKKDEIIIFDGRNKTFPRVENIHCHYLIDSVNNNSLYPFLEIKKTKNSEINEEDTGLEIGINNILTLSEGELAEAINCSKLSNTTYYRRYLHKVESLEIFVDFSEFEYGLLQDILEIKIIFENNIFNSSNLYYSKSYNSSNSTSSSSSDSKDVFYGIGVVAAIAVLGLLIYCCCFKKEREVVEVDTTRCRLQ